MANSFCKYEDILDERRKSSDLRWAAQEWKEDVDYVVKRNLSPQDLISAVMKSNRIKYMIEKEVKNGNGTKEFMEAKVLDILQEMCHNQDIGVIRKFAIPLAKTMKQIYGSVYVNSEGIKKLKREIRSTPVIFLPTHRSYADFLLISYISFHYHLPFPIIAAGMDFMTMAVIGDMLRGAGAFYIRRSFVNDSLYWVVFQEFVQKLICCSSQPVEFFLEGTRSRTGKTLTPKIGLLSCVAECWLRGLVPDIAVVPISISYNRTLEETLYAYEMLGIPKPKESTSGLLKAMTILKERYGDVYVRFGDVLHLSEFFPLELRQLNSAPAFSLYLTPSEYKACESFALCICRRLETNTVVSFWSIACLILLVQVLERKTSVPFQVVAEFTLVIANLIHKLGGVLESSALSVEAVAIYLRKAFAVHCETAELQNEYVFIKHIHQSLIAQESHESQKEMLTSSVVAHLVLQYYANQLLHFLIRPALVIMAVTGDVASTFQQYLFLRDVFSFDFVFEKQYTTQDFNNAVEFLKENQFINIHSNKIEVSRKNLIDGTTVDSFFKSILKPFLLNYKTALRVAKIQSFWKSESVFVSALQKALQVETKNCGIYSALSIDTCRQSAKMLLKFGALRLSTNSIDGSTHLVLVPEKIDEISNVFEVNVKSKL